MKTRILPFTIADHGRVLNLWKRSEGVGVVDVDSRAGIARYLWRNPGMSFVAKDRARVVGAVLCGTDGRRGYLHHLAVDKAWRRRGVGRALVDRCVDALQKRGYRKCHLFVFRGNRKGIAFWKSVGWAFRSDIAIMSRDIGKRGGRSC